MKMNSLISWVGGKKSIRDLIYARFPQNYGRYIEVFGGGGWVLFGKKPDKFEVYNDFNNNLSNMFAVVRDQPLAFIQELGYLPENGRNIFNLYKESITKQRVEDKFLRLSDIPMAQGVKLLDVDLTMYVKHLIQSGKSATDWQIQL